MSILEESRRRRGIIFRAFEDACEWANRAWYASENKQVLIDEIVQSLRSLMKQIQREIDTWEARR